MSQRDFQASLAQLGQQIQRLAQSDTALRDALTQTQQLLALQGQPLTAGVHLALAGLAALLAVDLQDYVHDALAHVVHQPSGETWAQLPAAIQELLDTMWPEEGGLVFLGKIGIAVVSEGFVYP
jgi:Mlc titration factor MtfA (ptsG expression regulator)